MFRAFSGRTLLSSGAKSTKNKIQAFYFFVPDEGGVLPPKARNINFFTHSPLRIFSFLFFSDTKLIYEPKESKLYCILYFSENQQAMHIFYISSVIALNYYVEA